MSTVKRCLGLGGFRWQCILRSRHTRSFFLLYGMYTQNVQLLYPAAVVDSLVGKVDKQLTDSCCYILLAYICPFYVIDLEIFIVKIFGGLYKPRKWRSRNNPLWSAHFAHTVALLCKMALRFSIASYLLHKRQPLSSIPTDDSWQVHGNFLCIQYSHSTCIHCFWPFC